MNNKIVSIVLPVYNGSDHIADSINSIISKTSLTETKKALINEQTYKAIEKNFFSLYVDSKNNGLRMITRFIIS